jgi:hypothetical protein
MRIVITECQNDLQTANFKGHGEKLSRLNSFRQLRGRAQIKNMSGKLVSERVLDQRTQNTKLLVAMFSELLICDTNLRAIFRAGLTLSHLN